VAFLINNPAAGYVTFPRQSFHRGPQHRAHEPIDNIDATIAKNVGLAKSTSSNSPAALHIFNHPQYVGGTSATCSDRIHQRAGTTSRFLHSLFNQDSQVFFEQPRSITISAKFIF